MLKFMSRSSHPARITPAAVPQQQVRENARERELLPEVYAPPEVIQGDGGDADWALWDACMAAWDQQGQPPGVSPA